jgi:polysaccharide biosynthesis transport protein
MTGSISLPGILSVLLRRKSLLLVSGAVTAAIAFGVSRTLPVQYASEGSLIIENRHAGHETGPNDVLTQMDVIQSRELLRRSVHDFHLGDKAGLIATMRLPPPVPDILISVRGHLVALLRSLGAGTGGRDADPDDKFVTYLQRHLEIEAKDKSGVIFVRFVAGSPDAAAALVNAIIQTYLATVESAQNSQTSKTNEWVSQQIISHRREIEAAEQRVTKFAATHQSAEAQATQLSKDRAQLGLAREDSVRQQAALAMVARGGPLAAAATLESKTMQSLKEVETRLLAQINPLPSVDPRHERLQSELTSVRLQIRAEKDLIFASLARADQIARANVQALEAAVQQESGAAQEATVAAITLRQLTSDLDAKRQLLVAFLTQASQTGTAAAQTPTARLLFQAKPSEQPVRSFGLLALLLGFSGGVAGTAGAVLLRNVMSTKIRSTDAMASVTGLPAFGSLPDVKRSRGGNILAAGQTASLVTETFRAMWVAMGSQRADGQAIMVTSSEVGEGKTTVAVALAHQLADDGFRVLLIDADFRRPRLADVLDLKLVPNESVWSRRSEPTLEDDAPIVKAIVNVKSGLDCLPVDGTVANPLRLFSSERFQEFVATSRRCYDFAILDSPPVLHVADPVVLARLCQRIVFIVQAGRVSNAVVGEAIRRFAKNDRDKMFTLLTRVRRSQMDSRDYYKGYGTGPNS